MITVCKIEKDDDTSGTSVGRNKEYATDSSQLAIIHVSSTQNISVAPMRKLTVLRNSFSSDAIINKDIKLEPVSDEKPEVYQQRKRMVVENNELFAALVRLPDKEMQRKLLDVINNHRPIDHASVETQTEPVEIISSTAHEKIEDSGSNRTTSNYSIESEIDTAISEGTVKRKKRKRKVSLPQANKESRTKQLAKMNKPNAVNGNSTTAAKVDPTKGNSSKRQRIDSLCISECSSDVVNIYEDTETNHEKEIELCGVSLENGLLPIQDAVLRNQTNKLNVHILIWELYKHVDLNDIRTEEDEDLLQLAVLNTCDPSIVSILLRKGLNPNTLDTDSNTVLHLAMLNDVTEESLEHLMRHIDLKMLLTFNDDGYTPLHIAVRLDRYLLAERLINILDERLVNKTFYKRPIDELETDENVRKNQFKEYYETVCLQMATGEESYSCGVDNHNLKEKLLQAGDRRSGNTALYFAIDNRFEHLIYFLLAHLTDPRTENLSGIDCKAFFCEFGKSLKLSLNIDNTMEKIIKLLS